MSTKPTILTEFLKRPVAYQPMIAKAFGSVKLGIFWSQLYYWHDKGSDTEGWIYKTQQEIFEETGLSRKEQETARKIGLGLGVLEEKLAGQPATVHYRIDVEKAMVVIEEFISKQFQGQLPMIKEKVKVTSNIAYLKDLPTIDIIELVARYEVPEAFVRARAEDVIDYCEAKGKVYKDYKAALRNFIKSSKKNGVSKKGGMTL